MQLYLSVRGMVSIENKNFYAMSSDYSDMDSNAGDFPALECLY